MKVKIKKCSHPHLWYADKIGEEFQIEFVDLRANATKDWFVAKTWNWFWNRTKLDLIHKDDCDIIDASGSKMADGYELGRAHGKTLKEQELVKEGILEDEPCDDDEELTLYL